MDRHIRNFLWGHRADQSHHLTLKSWDSICLPKLEGGLGLRKMETMNSAYLTKLVWQLTTPSHRIWTQLVRAKYLLGKPILDAQRSQHTVSWIWGSILHSIKLLRAGACYQIGAASTLKIQGVPWLPDYATFRVPEDLPLPAHITRLRDLMDSTGTAWNSPLVASVFPTELSTAILKTPILDKELERLVWLPSTSGDFSVKATHRLLRQLQGVSHTAASQSTWKAVWNSTLHNRHKLLLWKLLHNALPTLARLQHLIPLPSLICYLCHQEAESLQHFLLHCPLIKLLWWNSPWNLKIEAFRHLSAEAWLLFVLLPNQHSFLLVPDPTALLHFLAVSFEQVWLEQNRALHTGVARDWQDLSSTTNRIYLQYWSAHSLPTRSPLPFSCITTPAKWVAPLPGELKVNFDASFKDGNASAGVVLRNSHGSIVGAWTNLFSSSNPFCAEAEVAAQAFNIAKELQLERVTIEGDAQNVILAIHGLQQFGDWRAAQVVARCRKLLQSHYLWFLNSVPRSCNDCAHSLANWAFHANFVGCLDPSRATIVGF